MGTPATSNGQMDKRRKLTTLINANRRNHSSIALLSAFAASAVTSMGPGAGWILQQHNSQVLDLCSQVPLRRRRHLD